VTYLLVAARCLLGLVFAVSAFGKLRSPAAFRAEFAGMAVVPGPAVGPVAALVIVLEAAVPVLLIVPATVPAGLLLAAALLVAFSVGIAVTLARGTGAACRCFGAAGSPFGRRHLLRNGLLVALAAGAAAAGADTLPPVPGALLSSFAGLVAALLVVGFDDLAALVVGPVRR
jgi:uncharacterized membrane protein YphA (DoxX/SURF4 family)